MDTQILHWIDYIPFIHSFIYQTIIIYWFWYYRRSLSVYWYCSHISHLVWHQKIPSVFLIGVCPPPLLLTRQRARNLSARIHADAGVRTHILYAFKKIRIEQMKLKWNRMAISSLNGLWFHDFFCVRVCVKPSWMNNNGEFKKKNTRHSTTLLSLQKQNNDMKWNRIKTKPNKKTKQTTTKRSISSNEFKWYKSSGWDEILNTTTILY